MRLPAAALLMPYREFLSAAEKWRYDFERLASYFGVTFEHVPALTTFIARVKRASPSFSCD